MSKIDKLIDRLNSRPRDFTWAEAMRILKYFGYEEMKPGKTGGSRRRFVNTDQHVISLHEPHPSRILKNYQIDLIIEQLNKGDETIKSR